MSTLRTILITATRQQALQTVVINRGPAGPAGDDGTSSMIDVTVFGATGDGVTNDTAAIHAAIAAALSAGGTGVVFFPAGAYRCNIAATGNLATTARTRLIPWDNAQPVVSVSLADQFRIEDLAIKGNGAGTSAVGLKLNDPGGYLLKNVVINRFTSNLLCNRPCNFTAINCGFLQGNSNVHFISPGESTNAHTYVFMMCSLGGPPVSGAGRCFYVEEGAPIVTLVNCEQGNCDDYLVATWNHMVFNAYGCNWESFTAARLIDMQIGILNLLGGRFPITSKTIRIRGGMLTWQGAQIANPHTIQHNGTYADPVEIVTDQKTAAAITIENWNADFSALVGSSPAAKLRVLMRRNSNQAITTGVNVVLFNSSVFNTGTKYDTANGKFIPGKGGFFQVSASVQLSTVAGSLAILRFLVNGATYHEVAYITVGGASTTFNGSMMVYLAPADELQVAVYIGGSANIQPGSATKSTTLAIAEL
jgi:hypothetical protein